MLRQVLLRRQLLLANKNPDGGPSQLELWCLCGLRSLLHESPLVSPDLQPY
jgi:hypothetical protein